MKSHNLNNNYYINNNNKMILSCKGCGTKFKINKESIRENGRFVRCSLCDYEWMAQFDDLIEIKKDIKNNKEEKISKKEAIIDQQNTFQKNPNDLQNIQKTDKNDNLKNIEDSHILNFSIKKDWVNNNFISYENKATKFFVVSIVFLFLLILSIFIWGLENINKVQRIPYLLKVYEKIGVYKEHQWHVNNIHCHLNGSYIILDLQIQNLSEKLKIISKMRLAVSTDINDKTLLDSTVEPNKIIESQKDSIISIKLPMKNEIIMKNEHFFFTLYINHDLVLSNKEIYTKNIS